MSASTAPPQDEVSPDTVQTPAKRRGADTRALTQVLFGQLKDLEPGTPEHTRVRAALIEANLPLVRYAAARFRSRNEPMEDVVQVGTIGLINAIDRFDPSRGAFESYAVPTITGEVKRHFRDRMWALRVPRRVQELRNKVRVARRELTQNPGSPEPSVAAIAAHTGLTEDEVSAGMEALESFRHPLPGRGTVVRRRRLQPRRHPRRRGTPPTTSSSTGSPPRRAVRRLPERERAILYMRFFEDMTQSRIADRLGISQMHVSRLLARTLAQLRGGLTAED